MSVARFWNVRRENGTSCMCKGFRWLAPGGTLTGSPSRGIGIVGFHTEYFPPDAASNAVLYGRVVTGWSSCFERVDVVTTRPHRGRHAGVDSGWQVPANVRVIRSRGPSWRFRSHLMVRFAAELTFVVRNTLVALIHS